MKKSIALACITVLCCSSLSSYKVSALSEETPTETESSAINKEIKEEAEQKTEETNNTVSSTEDSSNVTKESEAEDSSSATEETTSDSSDSASQSSSEENDSNKETTSTITENMDQQETKDEKKSDDTDKNEKQTKGRFDEFTPTNFNLNDWVYEYKTVIDDGSNPNPNDPTEGEKEVYILKHYKGTNKNLEIPGLYNGHEIWLTNENNGKNIFPMDIESVKFVSQAWGSAAVFGFDTAQYFKDRTKLTSVDFEGFNFSNVTSISQMFMGCTSLKSIDLSFAGTTYVEDMSSLFEGCTNLTDVNLEYISTNSLKNMNRIFYGCSSLNWLDFSNVDINNVQNTDLMFFTNEKTPLLILTGDTSYTKLSKVDFDRNNRIVPGPWLDANGGQFSDGSTIISYFDSILLTSKSQLALDNLRRKLETTKPTRAGSKFITWDIVGFNPQDPASVLDYATTIFKARWDLVSPNTSIDNTKFPAQSKLSFAYIPKSFSVSGTQVLPESGAKDYLFSKQQGFNVGVYYNGSTTKWKVQANLEWKNNKRIPESSIKTESQSKIMMNVNNGSDPYNPSKDLVAGPTTVSGRKNVSITEVPIDIMSNNSLGSQKGVYDLNLGNCYLHLNNAGIVSPGSYEATVNWNLVVAPE
ncbi:bacterial surface protein 26-residue [Enterococcus faecium EnGen0263]|uniref:BspA family leucine-rich repeat surface protein n=1 Tax=Enterococcus faecium TaxID=1352 RepID=UPI00032E857B|nr:BspA family leucine-rich repeat surface protein [Enterococcus faecium]EME8160725.1 BspA family leucine-rich repeat surface protein [Enterococcus faecium]EOH52805.1 bacterial surface protein 26-residue [Enterococcus faecium EnGen0263]